MRFPIRVPAFLRGGAKSLKNGGGEARWRAPASRTPVYSPPRRARRNRLRGGAQTMVPAAEAIRGQRSAHSLATGPVMAEPFISPLGFTITPARADERPGEEDARTSGARDRTAATWDAGWRPGEWVQG
jgi:hypothetical protein